MLRLCSILFVVALASACGKNIGDACWTNVDCSVTGERFCDIAPPGGYCTVEGCDVDSCPGDSVCVRFYTTLKSEACTYSPSTPRGTCTPDERCLCDESGNGTCTGLAHCAPENSERRWCMKHCDGNGDCRDGYVCRSTGTLGAEPVPSLKIPLGTATKFCVSSGQ